MQIFELHFNPKLKEDHAFNTFIVEPENALEKRVGSLYMAGEITNALPKSEDFLNRIAKTIKKRYYSLSSKTPEKALTQTLKDTNDFFAEEVKKENVSWLGNLNFGILSIKQNDLIFTKTGDLKILLIRGGQITDIGKNLNLEGIDPYPVKIFFNVASGSLTENDILLVLTKDVFDFMKEKGILNKLANIKDLDEKKVKQTLPHSLFTKGEGAKISGLSLIFLLKKEKASFPLVFKPNPNPTKNLFSPAIKPIKSSLKKIRNIKLLPKRKISLPKVKNPFVSLKLPVLKSPSIERFKKTSNNKKKIVLIVGFLILLLIGYFAFRGAEDKKEKNIKMAFERVEEKVKQAEDFLIIQEEEEADKLFKEAYQEIVSLAEKDTSIAPSVLSLKETIEKNLEKLNKLERIKDPEVLLELNQEEMGFNPSKIAYSSGNIYLYGNSGIYKVNVKTKKKEKIELEVRLMDNNSGTPLGFGDGNIFFQKKGVWEGKALNSPAFDFSYDLFSSYLFNLYFLEKESCQIVKHSYLNDFRWGSAKKWNDDLEKKCQNPKSITIDGSIWILNQDNSITRYYTGDFQENITLDIFPFIENFTEIKTKPSVNFLYLLEPKNNRVVIISKEGAIFKQFQSESFNNLKSFTVSEDGKALYLLNNLTIYKITL